MPEPTITCPRVHLTDEHARRLAHLVGRAELLSEELARASARLVYIRDEMLRVAGDLAVTL